MNQGIKQVSGPTILFPAYGRTYSSVEKMIKDWDAGKDFRVGPFGPYCSIRDKQYLDETSSSVHLFDPSSNISVEV